MRHFILPAICLKQYDIKIVLGKTKKISLQTISVWNCYNIMEIQRKTILQLQTSSPSLYIYKPCKL